MSIFKTVSHTKLQFIFITVALLLFLGSGLWGFFSGIAYARSVATYRNVGSIYQALKYYYADQGRYPSTDQYYKQRILTVYYLADMPKPDDVSGICQAYPDFTYAQSSPKVFQLDFCLKQAAEGLSAGVHRLTDKGLY